MLKVKISEWNMFLLSLNRKKVGMKDNSLNHNHILDSSRF